MKNYEIYRCNFFRSLVIKVRHTVYMHIYKFVSDYLLMAMESNETKILVYKRAVISHLKE